MPLLSRVCHADKSEVSGGARMARSIQHAALDLEVVSLSPTWGVEIT